MEKINIKSNKEILDEFGTLIVQQVFDNQFEFIKNDVVDLAQTEGYKNLFKDMSGIQKREIEAYTKEVISGVIFNFLKIFEDNHEFKLKYEANNTHVNLSEISEMLKAEPIIQNGWIERFSKFD